MTAPAAEAPGSASERSDGPIRVNPRRFRKTLGTRAAESGYGLLVVADLLDHSRAVSAQTYIEATQTIRDRIDAGLAKELAPIAQAFRGTISSDEKVQAGEAYIADPRFDENMGPVGACAHHGPCNLLAPIACYTCPSFRAWTDGPHRRVLEYLIERREHQRENHGATMASTLDTSILAAARVVQLCEQSQ